MSIASVLNLRAAHPGKPALTWYQDGTLRRRYSYGELLSHTSVAAHNLLRSGVKPGDRVMVMSNNSPEMFFALLAIMSIGAIAAPISPDESRRVLLHVISLIEPALVVVQASIERGLTDEIGAAERVVDIERLFHRADECAFDFGSANVPGSSPAVILFTSGTTSEPKGVCLSHFNLLTNARGLYELHELRENPVHLCVLPLFHANAFGFSLVASMFAGSHVVLCNGHPGSRLWSILAEESVNIVSVVPQILQMLSARALTQPPAASLRYFVSAAAPLSSELAARFIATTGVSLRQGYGLSECVNFATTVPGKISEATYQQAMFTEKVPSIGVALQGCDVFISGSSDEGYANAAEEGEIVVTGDTLMSGYWQDERATARTVVDGALRTGDLGFYRDIDGQRFFFVTGRRKELIIRNAEKISPLAVEADLQALRLIGEFAVCGFQNAATGEEVGLYIRTHGVADPRRIAEVLNACAPARRPRLVMLGREDLPATHTGKIRRELLSRRFSSFSSRVFAGAPVIVDEESA